MWICRYELDDVEVVWAVKDKSISAHYLDAGAAEFFIQTRIKKEVASAVEGTDEQTIETGTKSRKRRKYGLLEVPAEELG